MARISPTIRFGSKILVVGEAPGAQEEKYGRPFVGASGRELNAMLEEAGIDTNKVSYTNVFLDRPPANDLKAFTITKTEIKPLLASGSPEAKIAASLPVLTKGGLIHPNFVSELSRLESEIDMLKPNVIVALGNTALWALCRKQGIGSYRGVAMMCWRNKHKVVATYHPAAILRDFKLRVIAVADLMKAFRESASAELTSRLPRQIILEPTVADLNELLPEFLNTEYLAEDIETKNRQITCISLAPTPQRALVLPFVDERKPGRNYWDTPEEEVLAWRWLQTVNRGSSIKIFQNGLYDVQYLARMGVYPMNWHEDTMILHHAIWSQLPKGLDFLGSIYTDEFSWKKMRVRGREKIKREE